ncbi:RimJ/RimL family protein N-acetyltransferase [Thermocatellispora tengchongensis]|uniref:RimJ/RimL family protein N-acetyltransferase n=1 Tax=Thermocatellispora tengchongensis TaxID=1073253 RepID=A0A840P9Z5_9ACTN|nr:GNAT family N-acetyltransferase [Thermocatellispora tengchongensis]MBB5135829.1 RimJ/RimL family protein N-acetyltransferase [Thermocatellispora tengchongensis]
MFSQDVIPAGHVELRPHRDGDAAAIARACSDPLIARYIPSVPVPYTLGDARAYLETAAEGWRSGAAQFAICDPATGDWVGNIGLTAPGARAVSEVGYLVAPWARRQGVATAATRAVTEWAHRRGVGRVELLADVENLAGQRVAMGAGFHREGVRRGGGLSRDGRREDLVAFARLASDPGYPLLSFLPPLPGGELTDGVVRLTPITVEDAPEFHRMMCDPDVRRYHVPPETPPLADLTERCRWTGTWWLAGERAELAIRDAATGAFAGHIQLMQIIPPLGQAMVGYSLLAEHRGKGFTTRAVNLLVEWAFAHTSLSRIIAGTNPDNTPSQRVLERAGFTREALIRGLIPGPGGTRLDDLQWARTRR